MVKPTHAARTEHARAALAATMDLIVPLAEPRAQVYDALVAAHERRPGALDALRDAADALLAAAPPLRAAGWRAFAGLDDPWSVAFDERCRADELEHAAHGKDEAARKFALAAPVGDDHADEQQPREPPP